MTARNEIDNTLLSFFLTGGVALDNPHANPFEVLSTIFNPAVVISLIVLVVSSLACRILGVVAVAKSKTVTDGEKAFWIIGFVLMSFITSIVFLIMAKGKGFME